MEKIQIPQLLVWGLNTGKKCTHSQSLGEVIYTDNVPAVQTVLAEQRKWGTIMKNIQNKGIIF